MRWRDAGVKAALVVLLMLRPVCGAAQSAAPPPYRPNPADEDWTFLKNAPRSDFWDPVKYIGLGRDDWSITLSGEMRGRAEGLRIRPTETRPSTIDNYTLQRYLFGADVRFGPKLRVFGELQSGIIQGRLQSPRPTDRNSLDLHQAFVEWRPAASAGKIVSFAAGRQEIEIGSSRLISASPGLNVKRSFDGVTFSYRTPSWLIAGAAAELVGLQTGAFDDRPNTGLRFWGAAAARNGTLLLRSQYGAYYLGIDHENSLYAQARGPEVRHTIGGRWSGASTRIDLNYDVIYQWGRFSGAPVRAWAFATETGFRLMRRGWRPRLSLRTDIATGDRDAGDPSLQSFNPLFPGNSYSGAIGLFGPTNLTDFTIGLLTAPFPSLTVGFELPRYWRSSRADGVYTTDQRVLFRPEAGEAKYVGTNPAILVVWQSTRHLQFQGAITRFIAGTFLENTFVSAGVGFYSVTAKYRF